MIYLLHVDAVLGVGIPRGLLRRRLLAQLAEFLGGGLRLELGARFCCDRCLQLLGGLVRSGSCGGRGGFGEFSAPRLGGKLRPPRCNGFRNAKDAGQLLLDCAHALAHRIGAE